MEIKSRKTNKKLKQQVCRLNDSYLSFPIFSRVEIKLIKSFVQLKNPDLTT